MNGRIILKAGKWGVMMCIGFVCSRPVVGSHEHSNEPSGSVKGRDFLD